MPGSGPNPPSLSAEKLKRKRDLDQFAIDLKSTIDKAVPSKPLEYRYAAVLSITWSNDTMGVRTTEQELLDVFKNSYGFSVESFVIPAANTKLHAILALQDKIRDFVKEWDSKDCLSIFVYSGHAEASISAGQVLRYMISGEVNPQGLVEPSLDWIGLSAATRAQEGDVLYIFDSCYASQVAVGEGPELLAAASWDSIAGSILNTSFTKIVAAQLKQLDGAPCSVSQLFGMIHRGAMQNNIAQVPIHVPHPTKNSIVLQKLETPSEIRQSKRLKSLHIGALADSESRVLISVHLTNSSGMPNLEAWKHWLASNIPPSIDPSQITIEGDFKTWSSLILVAMPVAIWTCLPANETAYSFVSFIECGGNRLLQQAQPILPGRAKGKENEKPGSAGLLR